MTAQPTLDQKIAALKPKVPDEFSRDVLDGARHALADTENPLRYNFFSTAVRILLEHMMDTLAPNDEVPRSKWFKPEMASGRPTRGQRIVFAIQGGLSEEFVQEELKVDPAPLRKRLLEAYEDLNKHVHGRENTIITDIAEQDAAADSTLAAVESFLDSLHFCREAVLKPIADALDEAAVDTLLGDALLEVDKLASHFSLEEVCAEEFMVHAIGARTITYQVTGSVEVVLQWGSNSDVRRGDGVELPQTFPFYCNIEVALDDPWDLGLAETACGVDVGDWLDTRDPQDR